MAAISWKSAVSGNWTTAADWSTGTVPGASDAATIGVAGAYTVSLTSPVTVNSLAVTDPSATLAVAAGLNAATLNNAGTINVTGGGGMALSGAVTNNGSIAFAGATTLSSGAWANNASLDFDAGFADSGGASASMGALSNNGQIDIGNSGLTGTVTVTATGIADNAGGIININGGTGQATLKTTAAAPTTLAGGVFLTGPASLLFGGGSIGTIAANAQISLDGSGARIGSGAVPGNSGLASLATVNGEFDLADGASVATKGALIINNQLYIDSTYGPGGQAGGSSLRIGGVLTNNNYIGIGNDAARAGTTVTATGLVNSGTLDLEGEAARATLDITGAAPSIVTNDIYVDGNALLEFGSGGIKQIGSSGDLWMYGADAHVSMAGAPTANGALSGLAVNAGSLTFANGVAVATTGNFTNNSDLYVDYDYSDGSDGGSSFSIGGIFVNNGTADIGNSAIFGATNVTAKGLVNNGEIYIIGNTNTQAKLSITAAAPATLNGYFDLTGDAALAYTSGEITAIGANGTLVLDGALAMVTTGTTGHTSSALADLASDAGNLALLDRAAVSTAAALDVVGALEVDDGGSGGSRLAVAKTLTNRSNQFSIGNNNITAAATVTAGALVNDGEIRITGATAVQASLEIGAAAAAGLVGNFYLTGDALLSYKSGAITTIAAGNELSLDGAKARVASGTTTTTNSALTTLTSVGGTFELLDGAAVTTTKALNDTGSLYVDAGGNGGSKLTIGGTLSVGQNVTLEIGNFDLTAATTVSAAGLANGGRIDITGGTTEQASLDIGAAAPASLSGNYYLSGDALLSYKSGTIATIATGADLLLYGAKARVLTGTTTTTNSALTTLSNIGGTLDLENGAVVSTTKPLVNNGTLDVDAFDTGGSKLTIGGTLTNNGTLDIGNQSITNATAVSATGLVDNSAFAIDITGSATVQASLVVGAAAPATLSGIFDLLGDALLSYKSGAIATIAQNGTLSIDGAQARVASGAATTTNSALTGLATVAGFLSLENGVHLSDSKSLTVAQTGTLSVDNGYADGGSNVVITGTLTNDSTINIGDQYLSAATTVSAGGLVNNGTVNLDGGTTQRAMLAIAAAAPSTLTGYYNISGDAVLDYKSGSITAIQGSLFLDGDARVASGTGAATTTNSALTSLASISGQLTLDDGAVLKTSTALTNGGSLDIDQYSGGGSSLTVTGVLTNNANVSMGNGDLGATTIETVGGLANTSYFSLNGSVKYLERLVVNGAATNSSYLSIGAGSQIDVTGGNSYTQTGFATTDVEGSLVAATVDVEGGTIEFFNNLVNGDGTGTLEIGSSGTLKLDGAVGTTHGVTFNGSSGGTLKLGTPGAFAGTISGFAGSDIIDLVDTAVTSVSYAGTTASGVLTVKNGSVTVASLHFKGDYTHTTFSTNSDAAGGTDILDPPAASPAMAQAAAPSAPLLSDARIHTMAALLGQYAASSFAPANSGHGASVVTDTAAATQSAFQLAAHGLG